MSRIGSRPAAGAQSPGPAAAGAGDDQEQEVRSRLPPHDGLARRRARPEGAGDDAPPQRRAPLEGPGAATSPAPGPLPAALAAQLQQWASDPACPPTEQRQVAAARILQLAGRPRLPTDPPGRHLDLAGLGLTSLPEGLGPLLRHVQANVLTLSGNALQSLPASLGEATGLHSLWLRNNRLAAVPEAVLRLHGLRELDLEGNGITSLPASIGSLRHLESLHLAHNQITALPEEITQLQQLRFLVLNNNDLAVLPPSIGSLGNLAQLSVQINRLTSLPPSLLDLPPPCMVYLEHNPLGAQVVADLQARIAQSEQQPEIRHPNMWFDMAAHAPATLDTRPLGEAARDWLPDVPSGSSAEPPPDPWAGFAGEPNAEHFSLLLDRQRETADYRNDKTRPLLEQRVRNVLRALEQDATLRGLCFVQAEEAGGHCGDRIALGLDRIEQAIENYRAERGELDEAGLLLLGRRRFRIAALDHIAARKIASLSLVDAVEVQLAYRTRLAGPLDLGPGLQDMLYFGVAGVSETDLQWAHVTVDIQERGPQLAEFLAGQTAWQLHLRRSRPEPYAELARQIAEAQKGLLFIPEGMSEQAYRDETARVMAMERDGEPALHLRLTQEVLAAEGRRDLKPGSVRGR
jgi:Leucine-rich repeat (LRR) protein